MVWGIFAGFTWGFETVVISLAMTLTPFLGKAGSSAPFVCTFIHDLFSAILLFIFHLYRKETKNIFRLVKTRGFKWLCFSAAIGGPVGMTGYIMAVKYMGASIGAVTCAVYPAIGTVFAFVFLKEKITKTRIVFIFFTLIGVFGLNFNSQMAPKNTLLGILGAVMCSFGWGLEAVILTRFLKDSTVKPTYVLQIRQIVSATIYGAIILPVSGKYRILISVFSGSSIKTLSLILGAALFATVSYLSYYKSISKIGATKSMVLNISYTAWSVLLSVLIYRNIKQLTVQSIFFSLMIVICGILSAVDFKSKTEKADC